MGKEKCEMNKKIVGFGMVLTLVLAVPGSLAQAADVEVSALNTAADLDLSGKILYAINFGNTGDVKLGGITFHDDSHYPNVACVKTMELVITSWPGGIYPNTGDTELDRLLGGMIARNDGPGQCATSVSLWCVSETIVVL
jgi:hypothetical protein